MQIADDLAILIREVFGEPAVVAGHSSGGLIASVMAARHPDLVRAVLFEDPPFFATEPDRVPGTYVGDRFLSGGHLVPRPGHRTGLGVLVPAAQLLEEDVR